MILYDVWYKGKGFDPGVTGDYIRRNVKPGEVTAITIAGHSRKLSYDEIAYLCDTGLLLGAVA